MHEKKDQGFADFRLVFCFAGRGDVSLQLPSVRKIRVRLGAVHRRPDQRPAHTNFIRVQKDTEPGLFAKRLCRHHRHHHHDPLLAGNESALARHPDPNDQVRYRPRHLLPGDLPYGQQSQGQGLEPDPIPANGFLVRPPGGVEPGLFPEQLFLEVTRDEQDQIFKTAVVGFACGRYRICVVAGT